MATKDSPCRILVMASGFGSNFQALIDAVASGEIPNSKIISLFVNRSKAHAVVRAEKAGEMLLDGFFIFVNNTCFLT
jgi:phosphoribosylglycinamide formyltransferase